MAFCRPDLRASFSLLPVVLMLVMVVEVQAAEERAVDFANDVRPVLARRCYACHGPTVQEADLALHDYESATSETESGVRPIIPGDAENSEIIYRVTETDPDLRMPPPEQEPLTEDEVRILRTWIEQGAEYNQHWAFQPLAKVSPPSKSDHPIDAFINAKLNDASIEPAPPADRATLIRRLYYDLTGLPPTPEDVDAFVNDPAPDAYEKRVDELLASPQYGERWARHWLDVVRYAETNSFERDNAKPNAWKYRDYVIDAFNSDKPYDQFLREQLAGDELDEVTRETLIAAGFYRLGIWDDEPADPLLARYDELDSIITTISQGMLGLTVNCARCHDHKIDPISQADYYSMLAFLDELTPYGTRRNPDEYSQVDVSTAALRAKYAENERQLRELRDKMHTIEQEGIVKMSAEDQRATEGNRRQNVLAKKLEQHLDSSRWAEYQELKAREKELIEEQKQLPPRETVMSIAQVRKDVEPTRIMLRGNPHVPGDVVQPAFPDLFGDGAPEAFSVSSPSGSSGKRRALAEWMTDEDNMLTARVMANRIWQHHFGRGIVRTPNNFGLLGTPPTHPELLNWLAQTFMEGGWKMKPLHRLIVTSDAYRRSSEHVEASWQADPNNDLFWRFDLRRLSAEEIRDSALAVTGGLNLKMHGPSFYPELSQEVLSTQSKPGYGWGKSSEDEQNRRSIYIFIKRSLIPPELASFDFPDTDVTCEARFITIQPAQALAMINGEFLNELADDFAARLRKEAGKDVSAQVSRGLQLVTTREPEQQDIAEGLQLIEELKTEHGLSEEDALKYFCLYALNLNEFLFVD
ncbi:PSD1 and planctomycete cytochrome C domain-containing protein [Rubinisphaera margarita]|uniref:PSD1 and planctomycete cytochrome C domain-containing protein n=1 Tax=Rubinisphaera margarita TaxID=2909586 RepID=UPI001EE8F3C4|nr:PSD1 and planctomycete cytochrome C domain-containing protein [Rubinisphaera margarita]MCG6157789.1 PSD1 and planctomycete cytochrome C domain-containing protein [Rubinisphaera margarita]